MGTAGAIHVLLFFSGIAGLGYQVVWTRMLSIGLGHEIFAVLAVVSAFFVGLAIGALLLDRPIARSKRPGLWYAGLELVIGFWTIALIWLLPAANAALSDWIGPDPNDIERWAKAFVGPMLLLLPATAAMGATVPAAERLFARRRRDGRGVGGLYAANAGGAMIGALGTAMIVAPALGYSATLAVFAAINLLCAIAMLVGPARGEGRLTPLSGAHAGAGPSAGVLIVLFLTGLVGIGYEVAAVRALAQLLENTVYSFAAALAAYLLGTTIGAALYQRVYAARRSDGWDAPALSALAAATAASCGLGTLAVYAVPDVYAAMRVAFGGVAGSIAAELTAASLVFVLPSAAMGALFAHLVQAARGREGGLGAAFAANTIGAATAPIVIGVLLQPAIGAMASLGVLSLAYLALLVVAPPRRAPVIGLVVASPVLAALAILGPFDPRLVETPEGGDVRRHIEGVAATATVIEDARKHRWLKVNGSFTMGGTASYALDRIQGHAALLQHANPSRALFLGVGTGATLASAAAYPKLRTDAVELLPEALDLLDEFPEVMRDLRAATLRISLRAADARRYVRTAEGPFDVVVADNFHPAKDGSGLLYTVEHFSAIRHQLSENGVFFQWLPLHQLDLATFKLIARSFQSVFPDARLQMGNASLVTPILALVGTRDGSLPSLAAMSRRAPNKELLRELNAIGLDTPFAVFGGFMAGSEALAAYVGDGPLNTDDHPRVLFEAPRTVYDGLGSPHERLIALTDAFERRASEAVDVDGVAGGAAFADRLERYWSARDAFLRLGAASSTPSDPLAAARALGPELVEIVAISPDYAPALRPAMAMAAGAARRDPALAQALLKGLQEAAPGRPEVEALRRRLQFDR